MKCPNCGYFNLPGVDVCGQCRRALQEASTPEAVSVRDITPPRSRNRSVTMQIEAHSPTARVAKRFAVSQWRQTCEDAVDARIELWNWGLALRWWLPPILSIVPGLGQSIQRRFLNGAIFLCATVLPTALGVLLLNSPLSNLLFFATVAIWTRGIFDAAHHAFPPASEDARLFRSLRLGLLSILLAACTIMGVFWLFNQRYGLWDMAGDQAAPFLQRGDGLVVERFQEGEPLLELERGDIVIGLGMIERVLGMPGDIVSHQNRMLRVNGKALSPRQMPLGFRADAMSYEVKVPPGQILLWIWMPEQDMPAYAQVRPYMLVNTDQLQGRVIGIYNPPTRRRWLRNNQ